MPIYRTNGMTIHMRGSRLPKPCAALVGLEAPRRFCADFSALLCDWPIISGVTCDAPLCKAHACEVGQNRHYCPRHKAKLDQQQPGLFSGLLQEV